MRNLLIAWALGACALGAHAQGTAVADSGGEDLLTCLVRPEPPKYPADSLAWRQDGLFRVELTFQDAESVPKVKLVHSQGTREQRETVMAYAQQFLLPCRPAGRTVSVLQEVAFTAVDAGQARTTQPMNLPLPPDERLAACLAPPTKQLRLSAGEIGRGARSDAANGNIVLELTFTAPDKPPQVKVLYSSIHLSHRAAYVGYMEDYRVPCLAPGERFVMEQQLHMMNAESPRFAFKDLGLMPFLRMVRNAQAKPVDFDLDTMACPFRVKFELGRPALRNRVTEVGEPNPNRRSFIAWMEDLELSLKREQFEHLLRSSMFIDVPCGTVKLG